MMGCEEIEINQQFSTVAENQQGSTIRKPIGLKR
jgi:hypothetical protein